jgi:hypothetical protein
VADPQQAVAQDLLVSIETNTLGFGPDNALNSSIDGITLSAWRNTNDTNEIVYEVTNADGQSVTGGPTVAQNVTELLLNVPADTINNASLDDDTRYPGADSFVTNSDIDPDTRTPEIAIDDDTNTAPTNVSVSAVFAHTARGGPPPGATTSGFAGSLDRRAVLATAAFDVTYSDADTTQSKRLTVDARYRAHDQPAGEALTSDVYEDVSMSVQTEAQDNLTGGTGSGMALSGTRGVGAGGVSPVQGGSPPTNAWVAQYGGAEGSDEPQAYTVSATGVHTNGTEVQIPVSQGNLSLVRDGEDAACEIYPNGEENTDGPEAGGDPCADIYFPVNDDGVAWVVPHEPLATLTVVPDFPGITAINPPEPQPVTVLEPYPDTALTGPDSVTVGDAVTAATHTFELPRVRADTAPYQPGLSALTRFTPAGTTQPARLHETFGVSEARFEAVLRRLATANTSTITNFVEASTTTEAATALGYNDTEAVVDLLDSITTTSLTAEAFLQADPQQALAAGLLAGDAFDVAVPNVTAVADTLTQTETIATDTGPAQGPALDGLVLTLYTENTTAAAGHNGIERFADLVTTHTDATDSTAVAQLVQDWGTYIGALGGRAFTDGVTGSTIANITAARAALPLDGVTAGAIYKHLDGLTAPGLAPDTVDWTNATQRSRALLLGGVTDPDAPLTDTIEGIQQTAPVTPSRATLAAAATTTPLDTDAFEPGGSYELAQDWPADRLTTTWEIVLAGAYAFDAESYPHAPTYRDSTTVSLGDDTIDGEIAFVGAEIDANDALLALNESGSISLSALAGQYSDFERPPLVVNDTTAVNVTVVTNAGEVYESGSLPMPPIVLTVTDTGGATVTTSNGRTPTVTATSRTTEPLTDPITIELGVAKTPGEPLFETVVGTELRVNAIGVSLRGDLSWTPPDYGQPALDQGPIDYSTSLEYTFGSAYSAGELVTRGVAPADHGAVTFLDDGVATYDSDGNQFVLDSDGSTYITIEALSEAAGLDVADALPIPSQIDAQAWLIAECPDTEDCDGDDDDDNGVGEPRQSLIGAVGEPLELASPLPSERSWAVERTPNTATGPQDVPYPVEHEDIDAYGLAGYAEPGGGNVWDIDGGPAPTITEDQTLTVYLYENFVARHYDDFVGNDSIDPNERLEQGTVSWRDDGPTHQCQDSGPPSMGCEPRPVALVDFVGTTGSTWTSSASLLEEDVSFDPTQQAGGDGGHAYDLEFEVTTQADVDPGNSTRVNVSFDAENSGLNRPYASTANLYLPVNIEETSDPDAPSPPKFVVHSVLGNGTQFPEQTIPQGGRIKNVGNSSGTQEITIFNDTGDEFTEDISLAPGETALVYTDVEIGFDDIGETANYEIVTENESRNATRTVANGGTFNIGNIDHTAPLDGGAVEFNVTVSNDGLNDGIVKLNITAINPDSETVVEITRTLYSGDSELILTNGVPHDGSSGETVTFKIETQDDSKERDVDIP